MFDDVHLNAPLRTRWRLGLPSYFNISMACHNLPGVPVCILNNLCLCVLEKTNKQKKHVTLLETKQNNRNNISRWAVLLQCSHFLNPPPTSGAHSPGRSPFRPGSRLYLVPGQSVEGFGRWRPYDTSCPRGAGLDSWLRKRQVRSVINGFIVEELLARPSRKPGTVMHQSSVLLAH